VLAVPPGTRSAHPGRTRALAARRHNETVVGPVRRTTGGLVLFGHLIWVMPVAGTRGRLAPATQ